MDSGGIIMYARARIYVRAKKPTGQICTKKGLNIAYGTRIKQFKYAREKQNMHSKVARRVLL